jgi:TorA maturation chaperone TorD
VTVQTELISPVSDEDRLRAETYILLAMLLAAPPTADVLDMVADLRGGDESAFGSSIDALAGAARRASPNDLNNEYHDLFIGLQTGELVPYASYYIAGALFSKPLAKLRMDMARLGIARARQVNEPEDHIAGLCEMMAGLILGTFGDRPAELSDQKAFFQKHLLTWSPRFFEDLERAEAASFYKPVGSLGRHFIDIENHAFAMIG